MAAQKEPDGHKGTAGGGPNHPGCTRRLARKTSRTVRWRSDCGPTAVRPPSRRCAEAGPIAPAGTGSRDARGAPPPPTIIGRCGDQQDDREFGADRNRKLGFGGEWGRAIPAVAACRGRGRHGQPEIPFVRQRRGPDAAAQPGARWIWIRGLQAYFFFKRKRAYVFGHTHVHLTLASYKTVRDTVTSPIRRNA